MNKQEIYDKVKTHLLTQNKKSMLITNTANKCLYRGPNSTMCAVGIFIPDDIYSPEMEGSDIRSVTRNYAELPKDIFNQHNLPLLLDLQAVHDEVEVDFWTYKLAQVAFRHGLVA